MSRANPVPTKTNPLGVKGAGEAGCVGAMPAVANAVVDALSEFGIKHIEMPATPERSGGPSMGRGGRVSGNPQARVSLSPLAGRGWGEGAFPPGSELR